MTIESVAARAGVSKVTIYRRWPDKVALVLAAARDPAGAARSPIPETSRVTCAGSASTCSTSSTGPGWPRSSRPSWRSAAGRSTARRSRAYIEGRSRAFVAVVERALARGDLRTELPADAGRAPLVEPARDVGHEPRRPARRRGVDRRSCASIVGGLHAEAAAREGSRDEDRVGRHRVREPDGIPRRLLRAGARPRAARAAGLPLRDGPPPGLRARSPSR